MADRVVVHHDVLEDIVQHEGMDLAQDVAKKIRARAADTGPVDTGAYVAGMTVQRDGDSVRVGSTVDYAKYVEAHTGNLVKALDAARET